MSHASSLSQHDLNDSAAGERGGRRASGTRSSDAHNKLERGKRSNSLQQSGRRLRHSALARSLTANAPSYNAGIAFGSSRSSSALVTLDLTRTSIGGAGATQLAHMLCSNSTLKHLDLSWKNVLGTGTQFHSPLHSWC